MILPFQTVKEFVLGQAIITKGCVAGCTSVSLVNSTTACCRADLCNAPITTVPLVCYTCNNCGPNENGLPTTCPATANTAYLCFVNEKMF